MPGCASRCGRACVHSMSQWPQQWFLGRRCGRRAACRGDIIHIMARILMAALIAIAIGQPGEATAARTLLADLMARPPAQADSKPMSALALEACLRRAQELD